MHNKIPHLLLVSYLTLSVALFSCDNKETSEIEEKPEWRQLFNGQDLDDWLIKITGFELHDNFANTFRINDGLMQVRYDGYEKFEGQFGHIFFNEPFSHYLLRVEYRFVGEQPPGGQGWAYRNSGAMLHSQDPATMLKDQDFPISIEGQLLGGDGENPRTTSNLCTPGTHVVIDGELITDHCVSSTSKTYHGEDWVTAEFMVLGDSVIHHILEGESVITYFDPQIGGGNVNPVDPEIKRDGQALESGYISLQSESHPIDFRTIELMDLSPYKNDPEKMKSILENLGYGNFVGDNK
ncbi:3-keto-disaccharide hydrolase [Pararhodonellum marinum]|uniref:3-keto-disaccharide hydrolase n=1 Tax=Pararhodonellum marinum TaxID=2755358 RepID=UPI00188F66B8|nr:DUF1080 domain-containing protein [Pararhodonellum marinum]